MIFVERTRIWTVVFLICWTTSLLASGGSWREQMEKCMQENQCAVKTANEQLGCCHDCLKQIDFSGYPKLKKMALKHPDLLCTVHAKTTSSSSTRGSAGTGSSNKELIKPGGHSGALYPREGTYQFTLLIGGWWESSHVGKNCNRDTMLANININVFLTHDNKLFGYSDNGVLKFTPISRCPRTMYGGMKTVMGPIVRLTGYKDAAGYHVRLLFKDKTDYSFTSGKVYASGNLLVVSGLLKNTKGENVKGILPYFTIPPALTAEDSELEFRTLRSSSPQLWWSGYVTVFVYRLKQIPAQ